MKIFAAFGLVCLLACAVMSRAEAQTVITADMDFGDSGPLAGVTTSITVMFDETQITPGVNELVFYAGNGLSLMSLSMGTTIGATTFDETSAGVNTLVWDSDSNLVGFRAGGFINGINAGNGPGDDFVIAFWPTVSDANASNAVFGSVGLEGSSINFGGASNFQTHVIPPIFSDGFESQPKFVFTTTTAYSGDLKTAGAGATGLDGADNLCNQHAQSVSLPGTYTAWISADGANAHERISQGNGPYYKPDGTGSFGELVADDLVDILNNEEPAWPGAFLKSAINRDERGAAVSGEAWTDTRENGNLWGSGLSAACQNWTTGVGTACTSGGGSGCGRVGAITNSAEWTNHTMRSCDSAQHLYCFQD